MHVKSKLLFFASLPGDTERVWTSLENKGGVDCRNSGCNGGGLTWGNPGQSPVVYYSPMTLELPGDKRCSYLEFDCSEPERSKIKGEDCDKDSVKVLCEVDCC